MPRGMTVYIVDAGLARCYVCEGHLEKKPTHASSGKGGFCYFTADCAKCGKELAFDCLDHRDNHWSQMPSYLYR